MPLALVQAWRNEAPDLVENPGRGQKQGRQHGQFHPDDAETLNRCDLRQIGRVTQLGQGRGGGGAHGVPDDIGEKDAKDKGDGEAAQGADDARAQFFQVFEERHAQHAVLVSVAFIGRSRGRLRRFRRGGWRRGGGCGYGRGFRRDRPDGVSRAVVFGKGVVALAGIGGQQSSFVFRVGLGSPWLNRLIRRFRHGRLLLFWQLDRRARLSWLSWHHPWTKSPAPQEPPRLLARHPRPGRALEPLRPP